MSDNFAPSASVQKCLPPIASEQAECLGTLESRFKCEPLGEQAIHIALESASFAKGLVRPVFDLIKPGESVCVVVSDHTRRTAADLILPVLFEGLRSRGCFLKDIFILFASGIHRHPSRQDIEKILGKKTARDFAGRIYFHDADNQRDLIAIGKIRGERQNRRSLGKDGHDDTWPSTARINNLSSKVEGRASSLPQDLCNQFEHEVFLNRRAFEADRLILTGGASFHYHAGFGGGRKSIVPGIAGRETIAFTHSLTIDPVIDQLRPGVAIGALDGNPVSEIMFECARLCPPDFIVNTVLAPDGVLAGVFAGEMGIAHRAACRLVEKINRVDISKKADFIIASAGQSSNWIQSHKAFYNAHRAVHDNGRVILEAKCPEGIGDDRFRYWVTRPSLHDVYSGLRESPEVLGQTALSTRERAPRTVLVTGMNQNDLNALGMRSAKNTEEAVKIVLNDLKSMGISRPSYYKMQDAMYVVPFCA